MKSLFKVNYDLYIYIPVFILCLLGVLVIYSASGSSAIVDSQINKIFLGFLVMFIINNISPDFIQSFVSRYAYWINVILLLAVILVGTNAMGATRWLNLGFMTIQPSELMKISLPLLISYLIFKNNKPSGFKNILKYGFLVFMPTLLVFVQPDLGTAIIIALSGLIILFNAGISYTFIFSMFAVMSFMFPVLWVLLMDYQKQRILTMFDPEIDKLGSGYHIIQSKIAIGNGGFSGKGFLDGTQTQLGFIPEQHTDFIFSAFSEEYGFLGVLIVFALYLTIILRLYFISKKINNIYQKLVTNSILFIFSFYVFVNMGMISGIVPVVGVPLPFFSYGGTFMLTQMICFGIVCSFYSNLDLNYKKRKYKKALTR